MRTVSPPRDRTSFLRQLSLVNAVICCAAIVFALQLHLESAVASLGAVGHWPSSRRDLVLVDRTGDRAWQEATRWAVEQWNAAGDDVQLTWSAGAGPCDGDEAGIGVCLSPREELVTGPVEGLQGLADPRVGRDLHTSGVVLLVCSDCGVDAARRRVIATHEVGHALGLEHTDRRTSVMYHTGGASRPDEGDRRALAAVYAHEDPVRCGLLNLRVGGACL